MQAAMKIAVAGATGRVGRHVVDVLEAGGHDVVADVAFQRRGRGHRRGPGGGPRRRGVYHRRRHRPSPDQEAATEFFTTAARNLHEAGERAGVQRMVVVSIIGTDRFTGGYGAAKVAHEQAMRRARSRRSPARRAVPRVRPAARGVGHAGRSELRPEDAHAARRRPDRRPGARRPGHRRRRGRPGVRGADPGDRRPAGGEPRRHGDAARRPARRPGADRGRERPGRPDRDLYETGGLLPGPHAILAGPTFEEWLDSSA